MVVSASRPRRTSFAIATENGLSGYRSEISFASSSVREIENFGIGITHTTYATSSINTTDTTYATIYDRAKTSRPCDHPTTPPAVKDSRALQRQARLKGASGNPPPVGRRRSHPGPVKDRSTQAFPCGSCPPSGLSPQECRTAGDKLLIRFPPAPQGVLLLLITHSGQSPPLAVAEHQSGKPDRLQGKDTEQI